MAHGVSSQLHVQLKSELSTFNTSRTEELDPLQCVHVFASSISRTRDFNGGHKQLFGGVWPRITAPLPETFSITKDNELFQAFSSFQTPDLIQTVLTATESQTGIASINRGFSERWFWKGATSVEVTLELNFEANRNAYLEVVAPIHRLMMYAAPYESSLVGNGEISSIPFALDAYWKSPPLVDVVIGQTLYIQNCWLKTVTPTFSNKLDELFNPLSATVALTFMPKDPAGIIELDRWFSIKERNDVPSDGYRAGGVR